VQPISKYFLNLLKRFCELFKNGLLSMLGSDYYPADSFYFIDSTQSNGGNFVYLAIDEEDCILPNIFEADEGVESNNILRRRCLYFFLCL
jgi:hypothetical protein